MIHEIAPAKNLMPLQIFISYRRDGDALRAMGVRHIVDGAFNHAGRPEAVDIFQDVRQRPGVSWPDEVRERLRSADIVLAIIGPDWLTAEDAGGRRRIVQDDDWVRLELEHALASGAILIPVVFGERPPAGELPPTLQDLGNRQSVTVREEYFEHDLQPVLAEIERHLPAGDARSLAPSSDERSLPYPHPPLLVVPAPLTAGELEMVLHETLAGWRVVESPLPEDATATRQELQKEFRFETFPGVIAFMSALVPVIEQINHHPRWENVWHTLRVALSTWDRVPHRITYADVMLAQAFDQTFQGRLRLANPP
jgi:pterin-4a-carbinolamine dehydratase